MSQNPDIEGAHSARSDLAALRKHQRQLLFGGGGLLTVLILLTVLSSMLSSIDDYRSSQRQVMLDGKAAIDTFLIQRDRGYMRSLYYNDLVWTQRRARLVATGEPLEKAFVAGNEQYVVRATEMSVPWLALGIDTSAMPEGRRAAYFGLLFDSSLHSAATVTERETPGTLSVYAYDDAASLFSMTGVRDEADLLSKLKVKDRAAAFARLKLPEARLKPATGPNAFPSGRSGQLVSFFDTNPFNGEPSLVGVLTQRVGGRTYMRLVAYEPVTRLKELLQLATSAGFMVVTREGEVALESGQLPGTAGTRLSALRQTDLWQPWINREASKRVGGTFFVAAPLKGLDWAIVHVYTVSDVFTELWPHLAGILAIGAVILALLWVLLLRMDGRIFAPALASASRVYESEALNRTIISTSPVGLCLLNPDDAQPVLQNAVMRDYAGRVPEGPGSLYEALIEGAKRGPALTHEFPLSLELADEHRWTLQVAVAHTSYRNHSAWLFALRDITAQAELEESLRQARHDSEMAKIEAESASRAKSSFVAIMSHEIRTPLNGILGHLELMARTSLDGPQRERLQRIAQSADSLLGIVTDVLDFSRIEAGQIDVDPLPFALRPLMEQVVLLFAPEAQRKGLRLYLGIAPALAPGYIGDVARIRQVLNNLLSNAIKFTESGRVTMRVSPMESGSEGLCFEVIDSGIGMSPQQLEQVFEPFSQADSSISRRFGGTGLGLSLCRQIADLLDGSLSVESTLGVGSVFRLQLPALVDRSAVVADEGALAGQRIALLSAALEWRNEIAALLATWGAKCTVAAHPSAMDQGWVQSASALVIFGTQRAWSEEEETVLAACANRVIHARIDGPLFPEYRDGEWQVSCYSSTALLGALRQDIEPVAAVTKATEAGGRDRGTVLLVEDHPLNRELIQQQLEALGFDVDTAEDGEDALRQWKKGNYVAVVTDINMPRLNGYELTAALRAEGATLPIFAATATALSSEKQRCHDAGITELLLKPLSLERLEQAFVRHIGVRAPRTASPLLRGGRLPEKVRRIFVESGRRDLEALSDIAHRGDMVELKQRLHAIKGALMMIGEHEVADRFASLEFRAESDPEEAPPPLDEAMAAMRAVLERYASEG